MKKVVYRLKSGSKRPILVPEEYASKAEEFVKLVLEAKAPSDLFPKRIEYFFLGNAKIMSIAEKLIHSDKGTLASLKLQDEIYIRCGIYGIEKGRTRNSSYNEEQEQFVQDLIEVVESL